MKLLEERIIADGKVIGDDILKVDMFLNHQIDVHLLQEIGKEFKRRFDGCNINKILTIEASGIGIACITAQYFSVPVVFAKKGAVSHDSLLNITSFQDRTGAPCPDGLQATLWLLTFGTRQ